MANPDRYGTVLLENDKIVRFTEKQDGLPAGLINGGIYLLRKECINDFPESEAFGFEQEFLTPKLKELKFSGYIDQNQFIDIGIPEDYERAKEIFTEA